MIYSQASCPGGPICEIRTHVNVHTSAMPIAQRVLKAQREGLNALYLYFLAHLFLIHFLIQTQDVVGHKAYCVAPVVCELVAPWCCNRSGAHRTV